MEKLIRRLSGCGSWLSDNVAARLRALFVGAAEK